MPISALDALLGFAMAYSVTYVVYVWIRGDAPAPSSQTTDAEQPPRTNSRGIPYRPVERG